MSNKYEASGDERVADKMQPEIDDEQTKSDEYEPDIHHSSLITHHLPNTYPFDADGALCREFLLERGYCCCNGCRNCPYGEA
jgi:Family of unknown function (DUF5522)